mgnify:FL=1
MLQEWIEVQFNRLQELADQMQTTADQNRLLADEKICQLLLETKLCWMGESADLFMEREVRLCTRLSGEADELKKVARMVEGYAKAMYCAEKCNEAIGNLRTY